MKKILKRMEFKKNLLFSLDNGLIIFVGLGDGSMLPLWGFIMGLMISFGLWAFLWIHWALALVIPAFTAYTLIFLYSLVINCLDSYPKTDHERKYGNYRDDAGFGM